MEFKDLDLCAPIQRALESEGYTTPTPIQQKAIPVIMTGRDLIGCAQTGTGKTAAFALPILQKMTHGRTTTMTPNTFRTLVLTPTRELAAQVAESFGCYGRHLGFKGMVIFGGVGEQPQKQRLRSGLDYLIATPGRLLDLAGQGCVRFDQVETLILDEADRMLDMGFIHDIRRILRAVPKNRQTLLFSATMPPEIRTLAEEFLNKPAEVSVAPISSTAERIAQSIYSVSKLDKPGMLVRYLKDSGNGRTLVFTRTKHGADKVCKFLERYAIPAQAIHGNKSQNARTRALDGFRRGIVRVLVATDIAARGIDVDDVTHVVNFDLPEVPETYVHRIGRTARAGASGVAVSFCSPEERGYLRDIERVTKQRFEVLVPTGMAPPPEPQPAPAPVIQRAAQAPAPRKQVNHESRPAQHDSSKRQGGGRYDQQRAPGRGISHVASSGAYPAAAPAPRNNSQSLLVPEQNNHGRRNQPAAWNAGRSRR